MSIERRPRRGRLVVCLVAGLMALGTLTACGSDQDEPKPHVPKGFEVPDGVTLTDAGSTVKVGKVATVVYEPGGGAASALSLRVEAIKKGSAKDFRFFSLDAASKKATPYYVTVTAHNRGPAGLGGSSLPVYAHSSTNTLYPANELVGSFKPCPTARLPKSFLADKKAMVCLIYLLPKGEKLATVDIQPGKQKDAIKVRP